MSRKRVWEWRGGLPGGTVLALAVSQHSAPDGTVFAATPVGLFRSDDGGGRWKRAGSNSPGPLLTAVVCSPDFARDGVVLAASLEGGVFRSVDRGRTWRGGSYQGTFARISTLGISPNFQRDGIVFAGTLGGGILFSDDQGANWRPRNFGLLDLDVLDVALSPAFERDETVLAATTSGVFASQNSGRAWRETAFPIEAAPVQCLAWSPSPAEHGCLYAGTEAAGVYRSSDRGRSWHPSGADLRMACINALAISATIADPPATNDLSGEPGVLMATDAGVYVSRDAGQNWSLVAALPGVLCLALTPTYRAGGLALAGLSRAGIYRSKASLERWSPANEGLFARTLTGLIIAPAPAVKRRIFSFGPGEGLVQFMDEGSTWSEVNTGLPSLQVQDVAISQGRNGQERLFAALPEGIWKHNPGREGWVQVSELVAQRLACAPPFSQDVTLLASTRGQGLWISSDEGQTWQAIEVPGGEFEILELALSPAFADDGHIFLILRQPGIRGVEVWQGGLDAPWMHVLSHLDRQTQIDRRTGRSAALAIPTTYPREGSWYAAIDDLCYRVVFNGLHLEGSSRRPNFEGHVLSDEQPTILNLSTIPGSGNFLLAATNRGIYHSDKGAKEWNRLRNGPSERPMMAVAPSPDYPDDRIVYALELGGKLWRIKIPPNNGIS